jgi:hypothetical protein
LPGTVIGLILSDVLAIVEAIAPGQLANHQQ